MDLITIMEKMVNIVNGVEVAKIWKKSEKESFLKLVIVELFTQDNTYIHKMVYQIERTLID